MPMLSLREACRRFAVTKPTLLSHLQKGKITGIKGEDGVWQIEKSELVRVYARRGATEESIPVSSPDTFPPDRAFPAPVKGLPGDLTSEVEDLRGKLAAAEARADAAERAADLQKQIADDRLGHIEDLRRMLPAPAPVAASEPPAPQPEARGGWWPFRRR